jgi:hypothetical protein
MQKPFTINLPGHLCVTMTMTISTIIINVWNTSVYRTRAIRNIVYFSGLAPPHFVTVQRFLCFMTSLVQSR